MEQNKFCEGKGKLVIFLILGVVILAGVAGIFYYKYKNGVEVTESLRPPKLFEKGDYRVEDRPDGQYIVVDKVGLTAKVPSGWRVEFEGNDLPDGTSQYWVNLLSPDAEVVDILAKGCGISILSGVSEENFSETKKNIESIQSNPQSASEIRTGYNFSVRSFGKKIALEWNSPEKPIMGQVFGIDFPIQDNYVFGVEARILPEFKEKCLPIWEDFVKNIVIK
ncbi:MAG: hypothetical protein Q7R99_04210 [bacterium]|nr:hypothetical protein [bacterium]